MDTVIRVRNIGLGGDDEMKFRDAANESLSIAKRRPTLGDKEEWNWRLAIAIEDIPKVIAVLEAFMKVNNAGL